jgi:hypothetical protein
VLALNGNRRCVRARYEPRTPAAGCRVGGRSSQSRWISRTGQVDGVLMRWPDSAAIKDNQGSFMAVE